MTIAVPISDTRITATTNVAGLGILAVLTTVIALQKLIQAVSGTGTHFLR